MRERGVGEDNTVRPTGMEKNVGLASLVLDNNYFEFNNMIYRQKLGTAIGTKFAPAYANLFMSGLEERLLDASVASGLDEIHR